jgi:hypothetical protein
MRRFIVVVFLGALVLVTAAAPAQARPSRASATAAASVTGAVAIATRGPALRVIALDPSKPKAVYKLNTAPGLATVIQLPEPWAVMPTCGDCVYGDAEPKGQLYRIDVFPETRTLSIKPSRLPSPELPPSSFVTNIDIVLLGGISVTLFVELTLPESADARVELTIPDGETGKSKLTQKERELEERFAVRVDEAAAERMLAAFGAGTVCREFFGGPRRTDGLVVRMRQLCKNGALLWVTFEIENRKRPDAAIESASLVGQNGMTSTLAYFEREQLRFNERSVGVAGIPLSDANVKPSTYTLTVVEDGGLMRQVIVDGLEF